MSDEKWKLPEIYPACAHPQAVWFESHWRPIFEKLKEENDLLREDAQRIYTQYMERGAAMRETGDVVRSLYQGSEVSKRVTSLIQERDEARAECERLRTELDDVKQGSRNGGQALLKTATELRKTLVRYTLAISYWEELALEGKAAEQAQSLVDGAVNILKEGK